MSREIKFRALEMDSPKGINWAYGSYIEKAGKDYNGTPIVRYYIHDGYEEFEIAKDTLGEYTGLKDKNGVEIYEGDIVKCHHYEFEEYQTGIIDFSDTGYRLREIKQSESSIKYGYVDYIRYWKDGIHDWYSMEQFDSSEIEIIGNIHENPELLEET